MRYKKMTQTADGKKFKKRLTPAMQRRIEQEARRVVSLLEVFPQAADFGGMHWAIVRGSIVDKLQRLGELGQQLGERVYPK